MRLKIVGSGCYIPENKITNQDFNNHIFYGDDGDVLSYPQEELVGKFKDITGIEERRYVHNHMLTSDIASLASQKAIDDAKIDPETLDYIIFAHNYGDVQHGKIQSDTVPTLASRVKNKLRIKNPYCVAYDLLFGCPGWIEGMIQANAFIKSGIATKCLVIGAETLSRVSDKHDRDSMIYADGAGAAVVEATEGATGLLFHQSASYTYDELEYLSFGNSYNKDLDPDIRYIKMRGRKIYEFALSKVPLAMKNCIEKSGIDISQIKKILIHQANEKMNEAIVKRFYKLFDKLPPDGIMPMCINKLGNSSVATIPTLYDLIVKKKIENQIFISGDIILFASVGAGMNVNAFTYRF